MTLASNTDNTLGILFDSVVVDSVLYGAALMQAWFYYRKYKDRDDWTMKILVVLVMIFDTAQMAVLTACVYTYCVTHQGDPTVLGRLFSTLIIEIFFSNLVAILVQAFYIHRIWKLCDRRWYRWPATFIPASICIASFVDLTVYSIRGLQYDTFAELTQLKKVSVSCNILAAISDIAISICLVALLYQSKTEFKRTKDMINRLMVFTFNTGLPTSISALMACIAINVWPDTFIYIFFFLLLGRFYTNSLLVTLNSRDYIRRAGQNTETFSLSLHGRSATHAGSGGARREDFTGTDADAIAIHIDTVKQSDRSHSDRDTDYDIERGVKN